LRDYGIFAATERVLMAAVKAGGDRQVLHEVMREQSLAAWAELQAGRANPLAERLTDDVRITKYVPRAQIGELLDAAEHVGDAEPRALGLAAAIRTAVANGRDLEAAGTPAEVRQKQ
jgi:adenylosuccinate lyase